MGCIEHIGNYLLLYPFHGLIICGTWKGKVWGWKLLDKFIIAGNGRLFNVLLVEIFARLWTCLFNNNVFMGATYIYVFLKEHFLFWCDF